MKSNPEKFAFHVTTWIEGLRRKCTTKGNVFIGDRYNTEECGNTGIETLYTQEVSMRCPEPHDPETIGVLRLVHPIFRHNEA